jgi:hypothetical protein
MAILERDVVLQGEDPSTGKPTIDFPYTRSANIEKSGDVVASVSEDDYIAIFTKDGLYMKTILVSDLLGGQSSDGESIDTSEHKESISIPTTQWKAGTLGSYSYYADITVQDITPDDNPRVFLDVESNTIASKAGVCSTAESYDGYIRFRSKSIPESDLSGICIF